MSDAVPTVGKLDSEVLRHLVERREVQLVDVRRPFDYFGGRIPGSLNLPGDAVLQRLGHLSLERPLVLICDDGIVSGRVAEAAQNAGFTQVCVLDGGLDAWTDAGLPLDTISEGVVTHHPGA